MTIPTGGRKTDETLLKRLRESARKPLTKAQIAEQRISWVYAPIAERLVRPLLALRSPSSVSRGSTATCRTTAH